LTGAILQFAVLSGGTPAVDGGGMGATGAEGCAPLQSPGEQTGRVSVGFWQSGIATPPEQPHSHAAQADTGASVAINTISSLKAEDMGECPKCIPHHRSNLRARIKRF
jgi:hypothetical protein